MCANLHTYVCVKLIQINVIKDKKKIIMIYICKFLVSVWITNNAWGL